jgi:hypothetical protein
VGAAGVERALRVFGSFGVAGSEGALDGCEQVLFPAFIGLFEVRGALGVGSVTGSLAPVLPGRLRSGFLPPLGRPDGVRMPGVGGPGEAAVLVEAVPPGAVGLAVVVPPAHQGVVAGAGRSAPVVRDAVLDVAAMSGLAAAGKAADTVAGEQKPGQVRGWPVVLGAAIEQGAGIGVGEQSLSLGPGRIGGELPRGLGGDGAVAGQVSRFVVEAQQR